MIEMNDPLAIDHTRHSAIFDASRLHVALIGTGGIGALTALTLAKMGVAFLSLYDPDEVDPINIATQFLKIDGIGGYKVDDVAATLLTFGGVTHGFNQLGHEGYPAVFPYPRAVTAAEVLQDNLIISAVDSITARQDVWRAVQASTWTEWYLDARMSAELFQLYAVDLTQDTAWYDRLIMNLKEEDVPEEPCTAKATIYTAASAAGHIGSAVRKIASGHRPARILVHDIFHDRLTVIKG